MLTEKIRQVLAKVCGHENFEVAFTSNMDFGDITTNAALVNAKHDKSNPRDLAEKIVSDLKKEKELDGFISKIEIAGPGFINFWLSDQALAGILSSEVGYPRQKDGKKIMVEYAQPNTHKSFHIGHLLNIISGESLARIWEASGHSVFRVNYQGDIGMHIAKVIYGLAHTEEKVPDTIQGRAEFLAKAYVSGNESFETSPTAKKEIADINKSLYEKSDSKIDEIYQRTRAWSLEYFDYIYERLDVEFDRFYFESEIAQEAKKIIQQALAKKILEKSQGAVVYRGEKDGMHTRVFLTKDGYPTYEGKDLALAGVQWKEYRPEKIVHVVGKEQTDYFRVVFRVISKLYPHLADKEYHQTYGWVSLKGVKMSSRKGNVLSALSLMDQVKLQIEKNFSEVDEQTSELIAQSAIKYAFLKNSLGQDVSFDINESISIKGDSGPYLQYTAVRAGSVLQKSQRNLEEKVDIKDNDLDEKEKKLMRKLSQFQDVISTASNNYSPSTLANYLYSLASDFNSFYNSNQILGADNEGLRILLTKRINETLRKGLYLLGIKVPDKM